MQDIEFSPNVGYKNNKDLEKNSGSIKVDKIRTQKNSRIEPNNFIYKRSGSQEDFYDGEPTFMELSTNKVINKKGILPSISPINKTRKKNSLDHKRSLSNTSNQNNFDIIPRYTNNYTKAFRNSKNYYNNDKTVNFENTLRANSNFSIKK